MAGFLERKPPPSRSWSQAEPVLPRLRVMKGITMASKKPKTAGKNSKKSADCGKNSKM